MLIYTTNPENAIYRKPQVEDADYTGVIDLAWSRALKIIQLPPAEQRAGWPKALDIPFAIGLQWPEDSESRELATLAFDSMREKKALQYKTIERVIYDAQRPLATPDKWLEYRITPHVFLTWLQEKGYAPSPHIRAWCQANKIPLPSSAAAPAGTPEPAQEAEVNAPSAPDVHSWALRRPERFHGYTAPLYRFLLAAHQAGRPCPKARDVLEAWREAPPAEVFKVLTSELHYYDEKGDIKPATISAVQKAINRRTGRP